ncbi:hypothetical protein BGX27_002908, partial [Mortierella sp. AM989]
MQNSDNHSSNISSTNSSDSDNENHSNSYDDSGHSITREYGEHSEWLSAETLLLMSEKAVE